LIAYADTGFLVSLYGQDANSPVAAKELAKSAQPVFILTSLIEMEFNNAAALRVFRKDWTRSEARMVREDFSNDLSTGVFRIATLGPEVWEKALELSQRHTAVLGTRTLDLLHVASALILKPDVFFTFDERQRKAAKAEHLRVLPA